MSSIQPVVKQFELQTRLFNNVLEGIEDVKGSERLSDHVNHLQWIAGHLTNSRYGLAPGLGIQASFPFKEQYTDPSEKPPYNRTISASVKYPSLTEIKKSWNDLATQFTEKVSGLSDEQLASSIPFPVPTGKTFRDLLSFITSHESYHIGQMSIIRKYLGLSAMSYK
ncbi:MAG TPA: DinB family protein [Puia sp.]|nr:DinB family protein [Puia sp.]